MGMVSERDYVWQAVQNAIEKRHGFPAGCGYTDAWVEHERRQITESFNKVEASIAKLRAVFPTVALMDAVVSTVGELFGYWRD